MFYLRDAWIPTNQRNLILFPSGIDLESGYCHCWAYHLAPLSIFLALLQSFQCRFPFVLCWQPESGPMHHAPEKNVNLADQKLNDMASEESNDRPPNGLQTASEESEEPPNEVQRTASVPTVTSLQRAAKCAPPPFALWLGCVEASTRPPGARRAQPPAGTRANARPGRPGSYSARPGPADTISSRTRARPACDSGL